MPPPEDLRQQYYSQRDLLSMYPGLREDHLRYLQKWGLIRTVMRTRSESYYSFADLLVIRQVSAELESAPFRAIVRSLQAQRSGQLTFDFRIDAEPARIIKLKRTEKLNGRIVTATRRVDRSAGQQSITLTSKVGRKRLPPGVYRVTVTAKNHIGTSAAKVAKLRIRR